MKGFGDNKKPKKKKVNELNIKEFHNQIIDKALKFHELGFPKWVCSQRNL